MNTHSARLFQCACCHIQVILCSTCDRGNIYCLLCAPLARRNSLRKAGKRYQDSRRGRAHHAARQKQYRQRQQQKVTHQGSTVTTYDDVLSHAPNEPIAQTESGKLMPCIYCHGCGRPCDGYLRMDFIQRYLRAQANASVAWPNGP